VVLLRVVAHPGNTSFGGSTARLMQQWRLGLGQNSRGEHIIYRGKSMNSWPRRTLVDLFQKSQPNHEDWSWIRRGEIRFGDELGSGSVMGC
jgi:hypothetical protein